MIRALWVMGVLTWAAAALAAPEELIVNGSFEEGKALWREGRLDTEIRWPIEAGK